MLAIWDFSTGYQLLGFLHVLAAVVAFGPVLMYPSLRGTERIAKLHLRMTLPALTLVWVLGMGMVGMGEIGNQKAWEMSEAWIVLALLCWVIAMAASWFLIRPALTDDSEAATKKFGAGIGITHLVLVVTLFLMIFKPGSGGGPGPG